MGQRHVASLVLPLRIFSRVLVKQVQQRWRDVAACAEGRVSSNPKQREQHDLKVLVGCKKERKEFKREFGVVPVLDVKIKDILAVPPQLRASYSRVFLSLHYFYAEISFEHVVESYE